MRESQKKFISLVYREQKIKSDYLKKNNKNDKGTKMTSDKLKGNNL